MSSSVPAEKLAAIILCGGHSKRMGFDKSQLPLGSGETFLNHIVSTLKPVVSTIVVARNEDRPESLDDDVLTVKDRTPDCGPLEGIASGMSALPDHIDAAFVTSCDAPLVRAEVVEQLTVALEDYDGVTPVDERRVFGLTALYRTSTVQTLNQLIREGKLKIADLSKHLRIRKISTDLIRAVDPYLDSLTNVNCPSDYEKLAKRLGFEVDANVMAKLKKS